MLGRCGTVVGVLGLCLPMWGAMRIEVVRGEGANNNALQPGGAAPAVRVLDAAGTPVRGALVVFTAPESGASVAFGEEGGSAHGITDESGVVAAPRVRPVRANGPVELRVMVNQGAEFVNTVIHLMNLGVGEAAALQQELTVVKVQEPDSSPQSPHSLLRLRVRVEDGNGRPVPGAAVAFLLQRRGNGSKAEEFQADTKTTGVDGEAVGTAPRRPGNQHWQFVVRAEANGRRSTAFFALD